MPSIVRTTTVLVTLLTVFATAAYAQNTVKMSFHDQRRVGFVKLKRFGNTYSSESLVKPRVKYRGKTKNEMGKDWSKAAIAACKGGKEAFYTIDKPAARLVSWTVKCDIKPKAVALIRYWNRKESDNNTTGSYFKHLSPVMGFNKEGSIVEGMAYKTEQTGYSRKLSSWYHVGRKEFMTVAHPESVKLAKAKGFKFRQNLGYIGTTRSRGCPLHLYYHAKRGDYFTTALREGKATAKRAGYKLVRVEGFLQGYRPGAC